MKKPFRYCLNPKNFFTIAAAACMILAAACRCIGIVPQLQELSQEEMIVRLALPVAACLLYAAAVGFCGKKALWLSVIPMIMGVLFFILRVFTDDNITGQPLGQVNIILSLLLYLVITVVYTATVTGGIRTKFILAGVILLPLAYHAAVEDRMAWKTVRDSLTLCDMLLEGGILLIMLGLFFTALGLKKVYPPDPDGGRKIVPPLPGGGKKVSEPEPAPEEPAPETLEMPEAPETPALPEAPEKSEAEPEFTEAVPVFIEEPEEACFEEPEEEAHEAEESATEEDPDAEPKREAAVPAARLSLAERLGLKKRKAPVEEAPAEEPEVFSEPEDEDPFLTEAEAEETAFEDD